VWLGGDHSWAWGRTPNGPRPELSHTRNVSYVRMAQCHADGLRPIVTLGTVTGSTKPRVWPTCLVLHKPMAGPIRSPQVIEAGGRNQQKNTRFLVLLLMLRDPMIMSHCGAR